MEVSLYYEPSATESEYAQLRSYLQSHGVEVTTESPLRHHLSLRASVEALNALLGIGLTEFVDSELGNFFAPDQEPVLPPALSIVTAILGLDSAVQARPRFRPATKPALSYLPTQVAKAYDFPSASAVGHSVALIELGGGFRQADVTNYFTTQSLPVPVVTAISVNGGVNDPTTANSADAEVMLDIEVLGSVAPGVTIDVYFAPNTDRGFIDAVSEASAPGGPMPDAISISWGGPESTWSKSSLSLMQSVIADATARGITVTVAAGDNGSSDGLTDGLAHVDFPASAPNALACGGTHLDLTSTGAIAAQTVWNDIAIGDGATGGGVSSFFPLPNYQAHANVPPSINPGGSIGRGVPDVAGNADPQTGYQILVDGTAMVVGGTSAVAPLMAGLIVQLAIATTARPGFVQPAWYPLEQSTRTTKAPAFFNIVKGNNGAYDAGPGWNPCTGLGSPYGGRLDQQIS
ncbi:S53 family peptidase [Ferrimicrobium acidiphilum]|uniref:S53 family peptidase n=1 Tax=Ferrimicrobium acidiphilum TaxID=121039 RepID=UPI0023F363C4|nr:S53 family peptidase [Ferrimicrobium acidiphilum]